MTSGIHPDWDDDPSKALPISHGDTIPDNGWLVCRVDDTSVIGNAAYFGRVYVNGVEVYYWSWEYTYGDNNTNTVTVPVSKGDVVTYKSGTSLPMSDGDITGRLTTTFYPGK